ncbi:hypothetical protein BD309DRAFT_974231 [Dichomitus squalens]|nr:hypothetical protein BD309DRAFT_974231 [Dichomitus squalens]
MLFRHWTLYDVMCHLSYVRSKLGIWKELARSDGLLDPGDAAAMATHGRGLPGEPAWEAGGARARVGPCRAVVPVVHAVLWVPLAAALGRGCRRGAIVSALGGCA